MEGEKNIPLSTRIAALVHAHFDSLPAHYKPRVRNDGSIEWTPMSGFVFVKGQDTPSETLTCVAVTSGARCLSAIQMPSCRGLILHDCHAEVLALRALNYWLINECLSIIQQEKQDPAPETCQTPNKKSFIRRRSETIESHDVGPPFEIHPDVKIYMYSTCAPCGDASMELVMAEQEVSTPWVVPPGSENTKDQNILLDGRGYFSALGVVRRKPSRADAAPTMSKSCSDKLALREVISVLSYPASILIAPTSSAYISALVLPEEEISRVGCERAFGGGPTGRMRELVGQTLPRTNEQNPQAKYFFRPFEVSSVPMEVVKPRWPFGKYRSDAVKEIKKASKPCNISAIWIASTSSHKLYQVSDNSHIEYKPKINQESTAILECVVGGVKQGSRLDSMTFRGASILSRVKMWDLIYNVCVQFSSQDIYWQELLDTRSYDEFKKVFYNDDKTRFSWLTARSLALKEVKDVLKPWIPNRGDENWNREDIVALTRENKKRKIT